MTTLYDALDTCLQEIENGADIESILLRYPDIVDELRPILLAAVNAKAIPAPDPSKVVVQRNRAKILQRAAEMREEKVNSSVRLNWFAPFRRLAFTFVILILVFVSGTNLVGAASTSLPGDELYPVKRSWERLQVFFLFDAETRKDLEVDHENERIEELLELFAGRRTADVIFSGLVTRQNENEWLVAGIRVQIGPGTELPGEPVQLNAAVRVRGSTQADGSVLAARIEILSSDDTLPEIENESHDGEQGQNENESESVSGESTPVPGESPEPDEVEFNGVLNVQNGDFWTINGMPADVSDAEVIGTPAVGAAVTVEGYFNPEGIFIVTKIEFEETDSNSGSDSNSNTNSNENANDNGDSNNNDDNGNDNNNNSDDGDNSGSGGGDDD